MLPDEAVIEYQQIYQKLFGKEIDFKKALEEGTKLINLVFLIEKSEMKDEINKSRSAGRN
jgi:hypothetical protein